MLLTVNSTISCFIYILECVREHLAFKRRVGGTNPSFQFLGGVWCWSLLKKSLQSSDTLNTTSCQFGLRYDNDDDSDAETTLGLGPFFLPNKCIGKNNCVLKNMFHLCHNSKFFRRTWGADTGSRWYTHAPLQFVLLGSSSWSGNAPARARRSRKPAASSWAQGQGEEGEIGKAVKPENEAARKRGGALLSLFFAPLDPRFNAQRSQNENQPVTVSICAESPLRACAEVHTSACERARAAAPEIKAEGRLDLRRVSQRGVSLWG